jgi:hypothetical protein
MVGVSMIVGSMIVGSIAGIVWEFFACRAVFWPTGRFFSLAFAVTIPYKRAT